MIMNYSSTLTKNTHTLKQVWKKTQENSCPYTYNFHLHTICSDGKLAPETVMQQAVRIGIKEMAITDHHQIKGYYQAQEWIAQENKKYPHLIFPNLWIGVEITSNLQGTNVHLLAYDFDPQNPSIQVYLTGERPKGIDEKASIVIQRFQKAGGLVILAHPGRYRRKAKELIPLAVTLGIDGVEGYYSYNHSKPWQPTPKKTKEIVALAKQYDLLLTCGTDTHGTNILLRA